MARKTDHSTYVNADMTSISLVGGKAPDFFIYSTKIERKPKRVRTSSRKRIS
ncbi:MAG: hypothetical protein ACAI35_00700 [Candidatus Methylacidiphilales bacterium]|nr:hypothetical protein [Candidatus Methylacidiphilales bacterium]